MLRQDTARRRLRRAAQRLHNSLQNITTTVKTNSFFHMFLIYRQSNQPAIWCLDADGDITESYGTDNLRSKVTSIIVTYHVLAVVLTAYNWQSSTDATNILYISLKKCVRSRRIHTSISFQMLQQLSLITQGFFNISFTMFQLR